MDLSSGDGLADGGLREVPRSADGQGMDRCPPSLSPPVLPAPALPAPALPAPALPAPALPAPALPRFAVLRFAVPAPRRPGRSRRLVIAATAALGSVAALGAATVLPTPVPATAAVAATGPTVFAPYVDATEWPPFAFDDPGTSPSTNVTLGFIVAASATSCAPSWGTYYSLDTATQIDLDGKIARLRARGGDVSVSFGGAANRELATVCTSVADLTTAYRSVVERYDLRALDLDLEGAMLGDRVGATNSVDRRVAAIKSLQDLRAALGKPLQVWLTLPVLTTGLTIDGVAVVDAFLRGGVDLAGVNVMTMDYGNVPSGGTDMGTYAVQALQSTAVQVAASYARVGRTLATAALWAHLGATPMIGQNDIAAERFLVDDAVQLQAFARSVGLGRISTWSANRDRPCPNGGVGYVAGNCSGVVQTVNAFAAAFAAGGGATTTTTPPATSAPATSAPATSAPATTIPATTVPTGAAPTWSATTPYPGGSRVSWRGSVYLAKWWSLGFAPDTPAAHTWDTPWSLVTMATAAPTTAAPTTVAPTTVAPTTVAPTTVAPTTVAPTTVAPTTVAPTTLAPTTTSTTTTTTTSPKAPPTTVAPTTVAPTTVAPTTVAPQSTVVPMLPQWRPDVAYWAGTQVLQGGVRYEAKWWSVGFAPDTPVVNPWDSPWKRA